MCLAGLVHTMQDVSTFCHVLLGLQSDVLDTPQVQEGEAVSCDLANPRA